MFVNRKFHEPYLNNMKRVRKQKIDLQFHSESLRISRITLVLIQVLLEDDYRNLIKRNISNDISSGSRDTKSYCLRRTVWCEAHSGQSNILILRMMMCCMINVIKWEGGGKERERDMIIQHSRPITIVLPTEEI